MICLHTTDLNNEAKVCLGEPVAKRPIIHGTHDKHTTILLIGDGFIVHVDENGHPLKTPPSLHPDALVEIPIMNDI